jgi:hypothetical protein
MRNFALIKDRSDGHFLIFNRTNLRCCPTREFMLASIIVEFDEGAFENIEIVAEETYAIKGIVVEDRFRTPGQHVEVVFHLEKREPSDPEYESSDPDYAMPVLHHIEDLT